MNLFINSPAYYTQEYGVIDDIYQLCTLISHKVDISSYTDRLDTIGITPIIAPAEVLKSGNCKEIIKISLPYRMANISLVSDYDCFCNADIVLKKQMIVENIFKSLGVIKSRLKEEFNYELMKNDIMELLSFSY